MFWRCCDAPPQADRVEVLLLDFVPAVSRTGAPTDRVGRLAAPRDVDDSLVRCEPIAAVWLTRRGALPTALLFVAHEPYGFFALVFIGFDHAFAGRVGCAGFCDEDAGAGVMRVGGLTRRTR